MSKPVVIDVETQLTFREAKSNDPGKLKISVAGIYDYATDQYLTFLEHELTQMFSILENASSIIGFNIIDFDIPALNPYYVGHLSKFPMIDLLKHVENNLGYRISLDDLVKETLGTKKTGHGLLAIEYFRQGEIDKLKKYCLSDVKLTKDLFEYGNLHGKVFYNTVRGRREIPVKWDKNPPHHLSGVNLTLPW